MDLFETDQQIIPSVKLTSNDAEDQFRQLIQSEQAISDKSQPQVALEIGVSHRQYQRLLGGQQKLSASLLHEICDALHIDKPRAVVAIDRFKDWHRYYDPTVTVAVDLLPLVVNAVNSAGIGAIEPMHPRALEQLAEWIANTVITHQEKICARREELELLKAV